MPYTIQNIANVTAPARLSLSGVPNFMSLRSWSADGSRYEARVQPQAAGVLTLLDTYGGVRSFKAVSLPADAGGLSYLLTGNAIENAENLKAALLSDGFIAANYEVYNDMDYAAMTTAGVVVRALEIGAEFNIQVQEAEGVTYTPIATGSSADSIKASAPTVVVSVDLFEIEMPARVRETPPAGRLGRPVVTLNKSYNGSPMWFDLNGVASHKLEFTPPNGLGWFNPRTMTAYRASMRAGNEVQRLAYVTDIMYVLHGFGRIGETLPISEYVYELSPVKLLTNKPVTPYVYGQVEYLTFMLGAQLTGKQIGVLLRAYNGSGQYLGSTTQYVTPTQILSAINTCGFSFSALLDIYPDAVQLSACLTMGGAIISDDQLYEVKPECYHDSNPFHFINRLGGWDTFNFDGVLIDDAKPVNETYERTVTPSYHKSQGVEATYAADLSNSMSIQGAPVGEDVAEWLKEFVAAKVIVDGEGRRVLLEDFTLREEEGENVAPTIKYRYSETYTNGY